MSQLYTFCGSFTWEGNYRKDIWNCTSEEIARDYLIPEIKLYASYGRKFKKALKMAYDKQVKEYANKQITL